MGFLKELLAKQRYPVILLVAGVLLVLLAYLSISGDLGKPQVRQTPVNIVFLVLGVLCMLASVLMFLVDADAGWFRYKCRIRETVSGFETSFQNTKICIDFGLFQNLYDPARQDSAVVLPANEFFDDRCFNDTRTAAGAFMQHFFPQEANLVKGLVDNDLRNCSSELIERKPGQSEKSYGVGTCVYLDRPLGHPHRIILSAVATDRHPWGLRTQLGTIFSVVEEVRRIVASQRLASVHVPLLGAGKGGVSPEVAFLTLVSSVLEARCKEGGHHLCEVHIVVFQPEGKDPLVARRRAKSWLRQLVTLYRESLK